MRSTRLLPILLCLGLGLSLALSACAASTADDSSASAETGTEASPAAEANTGDGNPATQEPAAGLARATFAGGCFWCMEPPFDRLPGVLATVSGYTGGERARPTYEEVSYGRTTHTEAVEILYDPSKITYERLLEVFWRNIDPTVRDRQFCDRGSQYRTAIFTHDAEQQRLAEASLAEIERIKTFSASIVTPILDAAPFYPAEEYHQNFYKKKPGHYKRYRKGCGRDARLMELWGDQAGG